MFAIRTNQKTGQTIWVRAGVAFVQPDDSMNLTLDVLPIDGQLHIREATPKHHQNSNRMTVHHVATSHANPQREEPATPAVAPQQSMGGH